MFWRRKLKRDSNPGWYGNKLNLQIKSALSGNYKAIPLIFCTFSEPHAQSKTDAAKALREILASFSYEDILRIDIAMRATTSMEWSIDWRNYNMEDFFTAEMCAADRRAVAVFASFNPNGYIRERAIRVLKGFDGTLPYIILRQNDWVRQVRDAAKEAAEYRLNRLSEGELLQTLPFIDKLSRGSRAADNSCTELIFAAITKQSEHSDLYEGLKSEQIRTRRICVNALFNSINPQYDLALEHIKDEPDSFLRGVIFRRLKAVELNLDAVVWQYLCDKFPPNRILAFEYLCEINSDKAYETAQNLLLDTNAAVRESARFFIKQQIPDFDYRKFYSDDLKGQTIAAIYGLGETGCVDDTVILEQYLQSSQIGFVKAAMTSLMCLDVKKYTPAIIEMLDDGRAGVVKTAYNLLIKYRAVDYARVREIFYDTKHEYSKVKCLAALFTAPKWDCIIYALEAIGRNEKNLRDMGEAALLRRLNAFNRSYANPSDKQQRRIRGLTAELGNKLKPDIVKQIYFLLK